MKTISSGAVKAEQHRPAKGVTNLFIAAPSALPILNAPVLAEPESAVEIANGTTVEGEARESITRTTFGEGANSPTISRGVQNFYERS
jgi:hypothetical protein